MGTIGNDTKRERTRSGNILLALAVAVAVVASLVGVAVGVMVTAAAGSGPGITTLGNQERQDITAPNQWVEGNIDFWLESHLYDSEVRIDAGSGPATLPDQIDLAMSFFFAEKNAIVIDWTQDWHVTFDKNTMFWTKSSAPANAPFKCTTPPDIVQIPVNGRSIMVPQGGSICIQDVGAKTTGNPDTGWADLMSLSPAALNQVLPKRNEPCTSVVNGLCSPAPETEQNPAKEHFFRVSLKALFNNVDGRYPQSWWPNLPAGQSIAIYWRNHLAITAIWDLAFGGPGGGAQPNFCITTPDGAIRNTVNRCGWTTVSRLGAGGAQGSKDHGDVMAPGIGSKTIPLPQVVMPTGFFTVCKLVTTHEDDAAGTYGTLTNGWSVHVEGPYETSMTKLTGSYSPGCARFGPLFPSADYVVSEVVQAGYVNIGTIVSPAADRLAGTNPSPANPVSVQLTFAEAQAATGATITFVNFAPAPGISQGCTLAITDFFGDTPDRDYAIAGDTVSITYVVTNTGNDNLDVLQTHTNTVRFGDATLFDGVLAPGAFNSVTRSTDITKADSGEISDTCSVSATDSFGNEVTYPDATCSVYVKAPSISFEKHPVAADNVFVVPGQKFTYTITVTNGGDAPGWVTVSDALDAGQTLLFGGPNTAPEDLPTGSPVLPATPGDYAAPTTIAWSNLEVDPSTTITLHFTVLVTTTVDGAHLTGTMTLSAANENGVAYTPTDHSAENFVTVTRPILKLTQFGYTNEPSGTPTQGVVSGVTTYTIVFKNYGTSAATLTGSFEVTVSGEGVGTYACTTTSEGVVLTGCTLTFTDVTIAPGATFSFQLVITYDSFASGAVVDANLSASYVTEGSATSYIPSGTPAEIRFTIQGS